jgi:hypothetical protein
MMSLFGQSDIDAPSFETSFSIGRAKKIETFSAFANLERKPDTLSSYIQYCSFSTKPSLASFIVITAFSTAAASACLTIFRLVKLRKWGGVVVEHT